jgi:hypothetical protein
MDRITCNVCNIFKSSSFLRQRALIWPRRANPFVILTHIQIMKGLLVAVVCTTLGLCLHNAFAIKQHVTLVDNSFHTLKVNSNLCRCLRSVTHILHYLGELYHLHEWWSLLRWWSLLHGWQILLSRHLHVCYCRKLKWNADTTTDAALISVATMLRRVAVQVRKLSYTYNGRKAIAWL